METWLIRDGAFELMGYRVLTKCWESYSRITKGVSVISLLIIFCIVADIGQIVGISDFVVALMGKTAKTASCVIFILYVSIRFVLTVFTKIKSKDNFTLWISLVTFFVSLLLRI